MVNSVGYSDTHIVLGMASISHSAPPPSIWVQYLGFSLAALGLVVPLSLALEMKWDPGGGNLFPTKYCARKQEGPRMCHQEVTLLLFPTCFCFNLLLLLDLGIFLTRKNIWGRMLTWVSLFWFCCFFTFQASWISRVCGFHAPWSFLSPVGAFRRASYCSASSVCLNLDLSSLSRSLIFYVLIIQSHYFMCFPPSWGKTIHFSVFSVLMVKLFTNTALMTSFLLKVPQCLCLIHWDH